MTSNQTIPIATQSKTQAINSHAVIILAGGLSQRLGQAKQLLYKDGKPLICYMAKLALSTEPHAVIIVIPDNKSLISNAITSAISEWTIQYPAIKTIMNATPEIGMAHSLSLGVEAVSRLTNASIERVLIMGVDQVLLDECHLTALLSGKHSVVASDYSSWQLADDKQLNEPSAAKASASNVVGLPLTIDYALLKEWQALLVGDKGLRHLIRGLPPSQISTVVNNQLSYDIDTPDQLAHAQQQGWLDNYTQHKK